MELIRSRYETGTELIRSRYGADTKQIQQIINRIVQEAGNRHRTDTKQIWPEQSEERLLVGSGN